MKETVRLPRVLPGILNLSELNRLLKCGEAALDWSAVEEAGEAVLHELLAGLDLSGDAHVLGLDSVPENVAAAVEHALAPSSKRSRGSSRPRRIGSGGRKGAGRPATWRAPEEAKDESVETEPRARRTEEEGGKEPDPPRVLRKLSSLEIREEIVARAVGDLLGPAGGREEEIAESNVRDRYLVGTLSPSGEELDAEEQDQLGDAGPTDDQDGRPDEESAGRSALLPSSLGMTFCVDGATEALSVTARWGRYIRQKSEIQVNEETEEPLPVWKRVPVETTSSPISLKEGPIEKWAPYPETPEVVVRGLVRRTARDWVVTLFLVNGQKKPARGSRGQDTFWLFQAELEVTDAAGAPVFTQRQLDQRGSGRDRHPMEERVTEMLYRDFAEFAVGHGVGVHWEEAPQDPSRAVRIQTTAIPRYDVPNTTPPSIDEIPALRSAELDMKVIAELPAEELAPKLLPLVDAYADWIRETGQGVEQPERRLGPYKEEAAAALAGCRAAESRIRQGIELLERDEKAAEAFRFANRAMWLQRTHTKLSEAKRRGEEVPFEEVDLPKNRLWYPFQLAFILLNLPSTTDLHHPDRSGESSAVADLLWYPTGGGKTETYLGLSAYVMALRRLQGAVEGRSGEFGVAVLMRYTLRLLTLQQFQRATALICACEHIRRQALDAGDPRWGENPYRIGLWVGRSVTPNTTEQSHEAVQQAHGDTFHKPGSAGARTGSPFQLVSCPWCGSSIEPGRDLVVEKYESGRGRTLHYCGDRLGRCLFSRSRSPKEGLPVVVVDEEIYRNLPALIISTVDKFAQMPWNGAVATLFGQVSGRCERHGFRSPELKDSDSHPKTKNGAYPPARTMEFGLLRPPDLIIQDELHLISGPLGTLVGLYETALDRLASWRVGGSLVRPKLIASTATIRRAPEQILSLFRRGVAVFPPQGLDVRDNFFSRQREPSAEVPGRLYLGICAQGRRLKAALIRTYTAFMSAAQALYDECGTNADPWMTAIGYFNSMRELGGMRRLVDDDISSRLKKMDRRGLAVRRIQPTAVEELTSRKSSTDIPSTLDRLEVPFGGAAGKPGGGRSPYDVVLATNMVSVGVDVQRLGLMLVCGQPKTTAEYIQATSRVGRRHPGLVVTVYNWARPRDLSHYEQFEHYHATFYKHVEALSVTPFAARALDRGLFSVLVSAIRLGSLEFNPNPAASAVELSHPLIQEAVKTIKDRAHAVTQRSEVADVVRRTLESRLDSWSAEVARTSSARPLGYRDTKDAKGLLKSPGAGPWDEFTCPNSMRDVEPMVALLLKDGGLDEEPEFEAQEKPTEEAEEES